MTEDRAKLETRLRKLEEEHMTLLKAALSAPGGSWAQQKLEDLELEADGIRRQLGIRTRRPAHEGSATPGRWVLLGLGSALALIAVVMSILFRW